MAFIAPFCGLRFNPDKVKSLEEVVTPPYDVIDEKHQASFAARNQYNMIKLDIRKSPGPVSESDDRYLQAKKHFDDWQDEGVLIRDNEPAIYLYHVDYLLPSGKRLTRKGLIALVQLSEYSEGIVKPHEETFGTVTTDRLRLMDACRAQFSQIFSFYSDEDGKIIETLEKAKDKEPLIKVSDSSAAVHTIWPITDTDCLADMQKLFADKALYIADGHHRYSTALRFQNVVREKEGSLPDDSPYRYVMMYLCSMEDPGLTVLPTHRLVYLPVDLIDAGENRLEMILQRMSSVFVLEEIKGGSRESLVSEVLARMDEYAGPQTVFGLYHPGQDRCFLLELKSGSMENLSAIDRPDELRELDVVVLSDLVIDASLGLTQERCEDENRIHYYSDTDEALDAAVKESLVDTEQIPLLFLMNHTKVDQVKRVADAQLIMPHKSTYFYPKILTGLLINKLDGVVKSRSTAS